MKKGRPGGEMSRNAELHTDTWQCQHQLLSLKAAVHEVAAARKYRQRLLKEPSQYSSRLDAELLHARDQCRTFDIHPCRSPVGTCYPPICDFQDADDLVAFIGFARANYRSVPAIVAQCSDWRLQCRAVGKDH